MAFFYYYICGVNIWSLTILSNKNKTLKLRFNFFSLSFLWRCYLYIRSSQTMYCYCSIEWRLWRDLHRINTNKRNTQHYCVRYARIQLLNVVLYIYLYCHRSFALFYCLCCTYWNIAVAAIYIKYKNWKWLTVSVRLLVVILTGFFFFLILWHYEHKS